MYFLSVMLLLPNKCLIFASILPALFFLFSSASGSNGNGTNVLLIVCDDLNDFEGVFGGHPQAQTPHMDSLAAESVQFVNAHTNAPICGPSRSSFLTGIYPHNSGVYGFDNWYNPGRSDTFSINPVMQNSKTLMHYMRDNGYQSYGAGKLLHQDLDDDYVYPAGHPEAGNLQEFWDEYGLPAWAGPFAFDQINGGAVNHPKIPQTFYEGTGALNSLFGSLADVPVVNGQAGWWNATWASSGAFMYVDETDRDDMQDEKVRKWAVDKINELAAIDPTGEHEHFIMSIGFHNPHTPFIAPQEYFEKYPIESLQLTPRIAGDVEDTYLDKNVKINQSTLQVYQSLIDSIGEASADGTVYTSEEDFLKAYLQAYLACVSFVDTQIGALITALDGSPYADNTIVILTSDHGYEWGEKEALSKNTLWENSTRVPLLIRVPGLEANAGKQVDLPVSLIDLYPTIKDLCGLVADTKKTSQGVDLDGHSLRPLLLNPENETWSGPPVALSMVSSRAGDIPGNKNFAVRSRGWRYIRYENGMEELYNHSDDPYEFTNVITSSDPAVVENYKQLSGELLSMVPELSTDRRNLIIDPSFEWLPEVTSPDAGEEAMWSVGESSANVWQVTRDNTYMYSYGKYSLKFNQRWTSFPVTQVLTDPLDTNLTYALSFWMRRDSAQFTDPGANDAAISVELWTSPTMDGTYQNRASWVTAVENTQSDVWQQFTGVINASTLEDYDGQFVEFRIVRNTNVKQRIYLDEFELNAYTVNSFAQWAYEEGLNPYISALDLDDDGLSCFEEYVFGGDPMNRDSIGFTPELTKVAGGVHFAYPERKNSDLSYQIEHSTDLKNWQLSGFNEQAHDASYDSDFWESIGEMSSEEDALFVRLKATLPTIEAGTTAALYTPPWLYTEE